MFLPRRGKLMLGVAAAVFYLTSLTGLAMAAPTAEERVQARTVEAALKKAGNLCRSKKYAEAAEAFKDAQQGLDQLAAKNSREVATLTAGLTKQSAKIREQLEAEGIKLPPAKATADKTEKMPGVSFTREIAPILVARCGACHVQRNRGELSMATYVALSRGSKDGAVIMPGDAKGSRMVELIESGDMPRGGGKVAPEELGLISAWINAGAKFDGTDSAAPLTSFSPSKKNDDKGDKLNVVTATGKEEVQFARDLGAIFLTHCFECHGQRNPRNNFSVETFNRLLRGGDGGVVLAPGKPDESLLVKKLRGMAGERMPLNLPPLGADEIAKFEKWIASGAKFDGSDPGSPLQEIVDLSAAERATHAELSERRVELAAKNWRLILPDSKPQQEEAADVLVYGSVSPELLAGVTRTAEEQVAKLRKQFKVPVDRPLIKGRLTLYVFEKRYDYGEVGTMLEHRELPAVWRGHWHYNPLDAYGCVLLDSEGHASPGLVAQQIAGAYVASLGKIPRWFAEGSARAVAAAVNRKDPRVVAWDENVARIYTASERPDSFLTGNLPPEEADILSYSFVKFLKTSNSRYDALMAALASGTSFAEAFPKAYGGSPTDQIAIWSSRAVKRAR